MSLDTILEAIEASAEAELAELRQETETRVAEILAEADRRAAARREAARHAALRPAAGERARRLHQAKLEALHIVGEAQDRLVGEALLRTRQCLSDLRHGSADGAFYASILRHLVEEAVQALGDEEMGSADTDGPSAWLEGDARDESLLGDILRDLNLALPVKSTLDSWGGVVVRSSDGRIMVINTLESRLERATPYLRQELAAYFQEVSIGQAKAGAPLEKEVA